VTDQAFTPREVVSELDRYIVGQHEAKRAVAIALRNRWRRQQVPEELRDEIAPKNIIMIGPTGVGKTEVARRLAKLAQAPFIKVEASKFTEVGYVGRDVESIIRDLVDTAMALVLDEEKQAVRARAEEAAEERLLDALLPPLPAPAHPGVGASEPAAARPESSAAETREKLRAMLRAGKLDERDVEIELEDAGGPAPTLSIFTPQGVEEMGMQFKDMLSGLFPHRSRRRRMRIAAARDALIAEEATRLVDMERVREIAIERVEQTSIVFIDEIDKVAGSATGRGAAEISREGVQRDLLPIVEGSTVQTKHGPVNTDHILFIAAGAFHVAKPSDLIPELQGRFPIRVELSSLGRDDFVRILTEPANALLKQYVALLATEGVTLDFGDGAVQEIANLAFDINSRVENIGARRLQTVMEKLVEEISFNASDKSGETVALDRAYVRDKVVALFEGADLTRFIL
jgi:ATP-dependent HslUV protease ATP-binding subunit HslU